MAVDAYKKRLHNRPIKEGLEHIKESKEKLADRLMEKAKQNKTPPWELGDLEVVLDKLKKNKSRDPKGLANELFKKDAAGDGLKVAILKLMNRIKNEQKYPKCLEICNITREASFHTTEEKLCSSTQCYLIVKPGTTSPKIK